MAAALAAAWFLVLQSTLGTFALAAGPQPAQLDIFGNVICSHAGTAELPNGSERQHLPACCVLGCNLAVPLLAGPPPAATLAAALKFEVLVFPANAPDHLSFARPRSPAIPRAPPVPA